jgi:ketosteroid isomerase-like protein
MEASIKRFVVAAMLVFVAIPLSNCKRVHDNSDVERAVMDAQRHWEEALKQFDLKSLQSLLAEDDLQTDFRGEVQDKASWLEAVKTVAASDRSLDAGAASPRHRWPISFDDTKVRAYGNTAVVTGRGTYKGLKTGVVIVIRFTNVWVKRRGAWQLVNYQATPIEPR